MIQLRIHFHLIALLASVFLGAAKLSQPVLAQDFTLSREPAGPELVGFGAQMNPYLRCVPNAAEIDEASYADYAKKVVALRPQHVRIFFLQHWFDGRADPISKGDPRTAESFIRACALAQRAGATINVTLWFGPWTDPKAQMDAFGSTLAQLINDRGLTAIRYVTLQNEVNTTRITMEQYNRLYRALDARLRELKLRKQIKIISGDLVADDQQAWFENLGEHLADVSDGYSMHAYWDYWDTAKLVRRVGEVPRIVAALPRGQQRPIYATEFGVRGHRENAVEPGLHDDGSPIALKPLQAMQLAWFQMEALNCGYSATIIWTMEDAWYDRFMLFGVIGAAKDGWPLKPSYHMLRLFTHTIQPGWRALRVSGDAKGRLVSAARGPDGEMTVVLLNQAEKIHTVSVAGIPSGKRWNWYAWNANGTGRTSKMADGPPVVDRSLTVQLPPQSVTVCTTERLVELENDQ